MKILVAIDSLGIGGAEILLTEYLPKLQSGHNVDVFVVTVTNILGLKPKLEKQGVKVFTLPNRSKWDLVNRPKDLAYIAEKLSIDIIHSHLYFSSLYTSIAKLIYQRQVKTVITFHNLAYGGVANRPSVGLFLRRQLIKFLYPHGFDQFLAISAAVKTHVEYWLGLKKINIVYNAVDLDLISHIAVERDASSCIRCVVPGRLVHEKGHQYALEAFHKISARHNVRLIFAGGGPLQNQLQESIAYLGLDTAVEITGVLERAALLRLISTADIVIMPSISEGFGLTAIEAMALAKPVIASDVGGLKEVIVDGETGRLVEPTNVEALVQAIENLINDQDLRFSYGEKGQTRVKEMFNIDAMVDKTVSIYRELVQS